MSHLTSSSLPKVLGDLVLDLLQLTHSALPLACLDWRSDEASPFQYFFSAASIDTFRSFAHFSMAFFSDALKYILSFELSSVPVPHVPLSSNGHLRGCSLLGRSGVAHRGGRRLLQMPSSQLQDATSLWHDDAHILRQPVVLLNRLPPQWRVPVHLREGPGDGIDGFSLLVDR